MVLVSVEVVTGRIIRRDRVNALAVVELQVRERVGADGANKATELIFSRALV